MTHPCKHMSLPIHSVRYMPQCVSENMRVDVCTHCNICSQSVCVCKCECSPNVATRTHSATTHSGSPYMHRVLTESPYSNCTEATSPAFSTPYVGTHTHTHKFSDAHTHKLLNKNVCHLPTHTHKQLLVTPMHKHTLADTPATAATTKLSGQQSCHPKNNSNRGSLAHTSSGADQETHTRSIRFEPGTPVHYIDKVCADEKVYTHTDLNSHTHTGTLTQPTLLVELEDNSWANLLVVSDSHSHDTHTGITFDTQNQYLPTSHSDMCILTTEKDDTDTQRQKATQKQPLSVTRMMTTHFSRSGTNTQICTHTHRRRRSAPARITHQHTEDTCLKNARLALNFCYKNAQNEQLHSIPAPDNIRIHLSDDHAISHDVTTSEVSCPSCFDLSPPRHADRIDSGELCLPLSPHRLLSPPSLPIFESQNHENRSPELRARSASVSGSLFLGLPCRTSEYDYTLWGYTHINVMSCAPASSTHLVRTIEGDDIYIAKAIDLSIFKEQEKLQVLQEAVVLRRMNHPFIVSYKDSFVKDHTLVIIMEFCEGGDMFTHLHEIKRNGEKLSEAQILQWLSQICLGVEYIHSQNYLHCDLKTTNIFLTADGNIKIGDFGIARELRGNKNALSPQRCPRGTYNYMSPEMSTHCNITDKSDNWALGCILYEMCTLKHAFQVQSVAQLRNDVDNRLEEIMSQQNLGYSVLLKDMISELLKKQPENRPSIKQVIEVLFQNTAENSQQRKEMLESILSTRPSSSPTSSSSRDAISRNLTRPLDYAFLDVDFDTGDLATGIHTHTHSCTQDTDTYAQDIQTDTKTQGDESKSSPTFSAQSTNVDDTSLMSDSEGSSPQRHTPTDSSKQLSPQLKAVQQHVHLLPPHQLPLLMN